MAFAVGVLEFFLVVLVDDGQVTRKMLNGKAGIGSGYMPDRDWVSLMEVTTDPVLISKKLCLEP